MARANETDIAQILTTGVLMKKWISYYFCIQFLMLTTAFAEPAMQTKPVTINIINIKQERGGQLVVFVFLESGFPKVHEQSIMRFKRMVDNNKMQMMIQVPSQEMFAIKVLHDENMDEKVTKNWTGIIPRDGIGFSNGARIGFGPPKFSAAKIRYAENVTLTIDLQYF